MKNYCVFLVACFLYASCDKNPTTTDPSLIISIKFDSTQQRFDAFGDSSTIPIGHAAQHPQFNGLSLHNIELVPNELTPLMGGDVIFIGQETSVGGAIAVDFDQAIIRSNGEVFVEIPINELTPGTYQYVRTSVTYQNYSVNFNLNNVPAFPSGTTNLVDQQGTVASFVGFNTYINTLQVNQMDTSIQGNRVQGFWAFESDLTTPYSAYNSIYAGQSAGTTVVNPLFNTTPIPAGSCLVTGSFMQPFEITGTETEDIRVELSYSTNKSFEWQDDNGNGKWDINVGGQTETVVDMGLRGLQAHKL